MTDNDAHTRAAATGQLVVNATRDGSSPWSRRMAPRFVGHLSRAVAGAPRYSPLRLLAPLRSRILGEMTTEDVARIIQALDEANVRCWLAGGWGMDALLGRQTRRHDDIDIVIDAYDRQLDSACAALGRLGFRVVTIEQEPVWMPNRCGLEADGRHRVDLLSLDWPKVRSALGAAQGGSDVSFESAISVGRLGGGEVPCLSLAVQRVLHSGFAPRRVDRHDLEMLEEVF
jgi:lincosamide nucleotidyltransferase A/C/D/E